MDVAINIPGGQVVQVSFNAVREYRGGSNLTTVLQKGGKQLVDSHIPGFDLALKALDFLQDFSKKDKTVRNLLAVG